MQREDVSGAQLHAIVGNFIAWLGYADIEEAQRPASRVQKGTAIFCRNAALDDVAINRA
ncbi:putative virulence effector protein [Salmonella enterica subsp. arizonae]|uniref:Putative virulence effector protein n=1 Tax=Salmonella enterica subsp. arizonae TaxID=59203 RepID=A0A379TAS9_SALER|nr:putative virulence effector protein [Salmonella enterica subsp. arizonae]